MLPDDERETIAATVRAMTQESIEDARNSADPIRAELARELERGTISPREAAASAAYREWFAQRAERLADYLDGDDDERQRLADEDVRRAASPRASTPAAEQDDEYFANQTILAKRIT
jgi:hypothetical protein